MPREILLGNGHLAVGFDDRLGLREFFFPHVGQENQTLGRNSDWALQIGGQTLWSDDPAWALRSRLSGANGHAAQLEARHRETGYGFTCTLWLAPDRALFRRNFRLERETLSEQDAEDALLLVRHNLVLGESDLGNGVAHEPPQALHHYRRDRHVLIEVPEGLRGWTLAREDDHDGRGVRGRFEQSGLDGNPCAIGAGDSLVGLALPANGEPRTVLLAAGTSLDAARRLIASSALNPLKNVEPAAELGHRELIAISRGQLRAHQDAGGAIMAGLDSAMIGPARESYAYCWPRDGALVARAALRFGDRELARRFLDFCRRTITPEGYFFQRYHADGTVASSWHPRPRPGEEHLPIQEDETALVALVAAEFLRDADHLDDDGLDERIRDEVLRPSLDFLLRYRDEATGLPLPSHDLWEERFGVHTFTVAAVEAALLAGADVLPSDRDRLRTAADDVGQARRHYLFHRDGNRFARRLERHGEEHHLDMTIDASLASLDFLLPADRLQSEDESTLAVLESALRVDGVGGIARYQGDTYYRADDLPSEVPGNPWVLCTAWIAAFQARRARQVQDLDRARADLDWILERSGGSGALAEQIDAARGEDHSIRPLTWSHAEYLVAVADYEAARRRLGIDVPSLTASSDPW